MGIIIRSFPGCGKTYLTNTHGDKVKILNAGIDFVEQNGEYDYNLFVDKVMEVVGDYDIVFIPSGKGFLSAFDSRNIDYDLFYPSKERRGEFIENAVRKRLPHYSIMTLDRDFNEHIDRFDAIEAENCYKHKMPEQGHFLGTDSAIMQYINNVKQTPRKNEQNQEKGVEESSRSKSDNEENESGNA